MSGKKHNQKSKQTFHHLISLALLKLRFINLLKFEIETEFCKKNLNKILLLMIKPIHIVRDLKAQPESIVLNYGIVY